MSLGVTPLRRSALRTLAPGLVLASTAAAPSARAQVVDTDVRTSVFLEPSATSRMRVITPAVTLGATPVEALTIHGGYAADVVSGASESVKAGPSFSDTPDIVSAASVTDLRQVVNGGVVLHHGHTDIGAAYAYGTENDYRSNTVSATAGTDFFQRNTKLEFGFSHGFDKVCDVAGNEVQAVTARQALDQSKGCFTSDVTRRSLDVAADNFQGGWTQSWTPVFASQLVLTGAVQRGFLSNPYRSVVIGPSGEMAQEHHPENRSRGAVALRLKYFVRPLDAAIGLGGRAYRDTWDIVSQTYEADFEKSLGSWLRVQVRGRYYRQTAAVFWSDDYTGGEPLNGPRGQYFSGDREVSPMKSLLGGARLTGSWHGRPGGRVAHLFLDFDASLGVTLLKTYLDNFTWAGRTPDDTLAVIFGGNATATF